MISESITRAIHVAEHPPAKPGEPQATVPLAPEEKVVLALNHIGEQLRMAKGDPVAVQVIADQLIEHDQKIAATLLATSPRATSRPAPAPAGGFSIDKV